MTITLLLAGILIALFVIALCLFRLTGIQPAVNISVPEAPVPVIKFMLPSDIQKIAQDAHRAVVEQRQPDGTWSEVGHFDFGSEDDPATWPKRAHDELAADGRRFVFPSGRIVEHPVEPAETA